MTLRKVWRINCGPAAIFSVALVPFLAACEIDRTPETERIIEDTSPAVTYTVRMDSERSDPGDFQLAFGGEGLHILTGPAGDER